MWQVFCRTCCPCCPCSPDDNELHRDPSTFYTPHPPHILEAKVDNETSKTQKLPVQVIDLRKEDNMLVGQDNPGFTDVLDNPSTEPLHLSSPILTITPSSPKPELNPQNTQLVQAQKPRALRHKHSMGNLQRQVSTYNYPPRSALDLDIVKGQHLEVIEDQGEWVIARTIDGQGQSKTGYIPKTFLANEGSLEAEDWYFGSMTKLDAKRCLLQEENCSGSFLVWQKVGDNGYYISVRVDEVVRHYKVHQSTNGDFFLVKRASCSSLKDLVHHYQQQCDGLCTKLETPCVKLDLPSVNSICYTTVDHLEIQPSSIKKVTRLGSGKFGMVWLGLWNGTTKVAVKELQVSAESLQQTLYGEAETMWKLSHEKLLKLYAVCLQTKPVFIVTEYMPQGNLKKYLQAHDKYKDLPFSQLVDFGVQISQGMDYMEQKGCVHRDLRAENIFLSAMMNCKIGDFGLARFMDSTSMAVTADVQIPIKWTAPEVFQDQKYTSKSDLWSFGVLLGEIFTYGKMPFPNKTNKDYCQDIIYRKELDPPEESPERISYIMRMCWRYEPKSRPSFCEIQGFLMELVTPMLDDDVVE